MMQLKSNIPISKIDCYIHFAVKAGKVIWGIDNLIKTRKKITIILFDETIGQNSKKELDRYIQQKQTKALPLPGDYLNKLLHRENVKVLAITDSSLGEAILNYCE